MQSDLFQQDLYPETAGDTPAISAEEWAEGKDADPVLVNTRRFMLPAPRLCLRRVSYGRTRRPAR